MSLFSGESSSPPAKEGEFLRRARRLGRALRAKPIAIALSLVITILALGLALRGVEMESVLEAMASMRPGPLILALAVLVLGTLIRALRWHGMMRAAGSTFTASLEAVLVSLFFNGVLPLRSGEAIRVVYFARRAQAPLMATAAALVLERTLDMISLALLASIFLSGALGGRLSGLPFPPYFLGLGAGLAILGLIVLGLVLQRRAASGRGSTGPKRDSWLALRLEEAFQGLRSLGEGAGAAWIFGLSLCMWALTVVPMLLVFSALGTSISYTDGAVIVIAITFAIALPSSPGFVGTYHVGFVAGAILVGIPKETAVPAAIASHLLGQIPFILAGGVVLATGGRKVLARREEAG